MTGQEIKMNNYGIKYAIYEGWLQLPSGDRIYTGSMHLCMFCKDKDCMDSQRNTFKGQIIACDKFQQKDRY